MKLTGIKQIALLYEEDCVEGVFNFDKPVDLDEKAQAEIRRAFDPYAIVYVYADDVIRAPSLEAVLDVALEPDWRGALRAREELHARAAAAREGR